ncbi:MAG: acetoin utilization protein AcuC [Alphaproteobacteria bacterium]|nr:acetoin utilization protein AcuC [Alphaproteobacteria bacterium]
MPPKSPLFVGSPVFRRAAYGGNHPLAIPRVASVMDLCEMLGWLDDGNFRESRAASVDELARFHTRDYIGALRASEEAGKVPVEIRERYNLGNRENPVFAGVFERASTAAGGSILAARLAMECGLAYHPSGGTHHGRPDRASGFCYFNDPVFAILSFLDEGAGRVLYVDVDAHHGDGVQDAFAGDERVLTVSIHEAGRFPFSGPADDRGGGNARNFPVPRGFNDSELDYLMEAAVLPLGHDFAPDAVVITCGADGLAGDPLSAMALSNVALWRAVGMAAALSPATVVLGGGGYNPWTVARCWTGLWGYLNGWPAGEELPAAARELLHGLDSDLVDEEDRPNEWFTTLADAPAPGPVRDEIKAVARTVLNGV